MGRLKRVYFLNLIRTFIFSMQEFTPLQKNGGVAIESSHFDGLYLLLILYYYDYYYYYIFLFYNAS